MHNIVLRNSWLVAMQIWFGFQSNGMGLGHYCDTQVDQDIYQSLQSSKVKIKKHSQISCDNITYCNPGCSDMNVTFG